MSGRDVDVVIGPHVARPLADDVVRVRWNGDVLGEHVIALGKVIAARPHEGRGVFLLQDHTRIGQMTAEARKQIRHNENAPIVRKVVVIGASFQLRVVMTMLQKAIDVFLPKNEGITFFDSEAEAMAFIEETRRKKPRGLDG